MAKTAYIAIDANGTTHTRNSDRVYTHTVVYRQSKADRMAYATSKDWRDADGKNYDYAAACIANGKHLNLMSFAHYANDTARHAKDVQESVAHNRGLTREDYISTRQAERVAIVEATDFSVWHNAGWCGRLDLAQKLAAKFSDVAILPATTK